MKFCSTACETTSASATAAERPFPCITGAGCAMPVTSGTGKPVAALEPSPHWIPSLAAPLPPLTGPGACPPMGRDLSPPFCMAAALRLRALPRSRLLSICYVPRYVPPPEAVVLGLLGELYSVTTGSQQQKSLSMLCAINRTLKFRGLHMPWVDPPDTSRSSGTTNLMHRYWQS